MDESKHKERNRENKKREREREGKQPNDEKNPRMIPKRKENNLTREDAELKDEEEQRRLGEEIQKRRRRAQELLEYFMRKNEEANLVMNYGVEELEINDFPQNARWRLTRKETLVPISEWTGAAIGTRGQYFAPGRIPGLGERKLYLFIEGPNEQSVKRAKSELKRVLEDIMKQALQSASHPGKINFTKTRLPTENGHEVASLENYKWKTIYNWIESMKE